MQHLRIAGGITAGITKYEEKEFHHDPHIHDKTNISFVLEGGWRDDMERLPGSLVWYPAGKLHHVVGMAELSRHINIAIEPGFLRKFDLSEGGMFTSLSKNPDAKFLMLDIYRELMAGDEF